MQAQDSQKKNSITLHVTTSTGPEFLCTANPQQKTNQLLPQIFKLYEKAQEANKIVEEDGLQVPLSKSVGNNFDDNDKVFCEIENEPKTEIAKGQSKQKKQPKPSKNLPTEPKSQTVPKTKKIKKEDKEVKNRKQKSGNQDSESQSISSLIKVENPIIQENQPILNEDSQQTNQQLQTFNYINRLRQTAKIARQVIRMIQNPFEASELEKQAHGSDFQFGEVQSYALAERIKNALKKLNTYPESRDDVLQLFTKGINIQKNLESIFHQARIQRAKSGKNLVYCPNSIITSQIFSILSQQPPYHYLNIQRLMLTGYKGISKTMSVTLLWHLTRFINEYRFYQTKDGNQINQQFNQPIIVYLSVKPSDTKLQVVKKLLKQLPKIDIKKYSAQKIIKDQINIGDFYQENFGLDVQLVIDQINTVAKMDRQIDTKIKNNQGNAQDNKSQRDKVYRLMNLIRDISYMFNKTVYLSSMDIEKQFLNKCNLSGDLGHTPIKVGQVNYANSVYKDQCLIELCHFYLFQFNEKILKPKKVQITSQQQLNKIQQKCIQYLKEKINNKEYFFITFYDIFTHWEQRYDTQVKERDYTTFLAQNFKEMVDESTKKTSKEFHSHFLKGDSLDSERKILILNLVQQIKKMIAQQQQRNQEKTSKQQNQSNLDEILLSELNYLEQDDLKNVLPLTFFSLPTDKKTIHLRLPARFTYQLLSPKVEQWLTFYLKNANDWMKKTDSVSSLGTSIENLFILALKKGNTTFKILPKKQVKNQFTVEPTKYSSIRKGSYPFESLRPKDTLDDKKKTQSLFPKLTQSLKKMLENKQECAVFQPINKKFNELKFENVQQHYHLINSKAIDLILARVKSGINNQIELDIIDVTMEKSKNVIREKITKFLNTFQTLSDNDKTEIQLYPEQLNEKKNFIALRYLVFCGKESEDNLLKSLSRTFNSTLNFKGPGNANIFQVSLKNNKKSPLKEVGFINIGSDIKFQKGKDDVDVLSFQQACRVHNFKNDRITQAQNSIKRK